MGIYDMLPNGGQVKCWYSDMRTVEKGDIVPVLCDTGHIILLREGGYVKIGSDGTVLNIVEGKHLYYPEDFPGIPCFNKWGSEVSSRSELIGLFHGIQDMDDPYYFIEGER